MFFLSMYFAVNPEVWPNACVVERWAAQICCKLALLLRDRDLLCDRESKLWTPNMPWLTV